MSLISHRSVATSIFYSTYKFRLQRLLISCLYLCSTYKIYGICNILSLIALLVDQLSAFNASPRVHNKPYDHRLHKGYFLKWLQNLILWDEDLHLSVVYLQASSFHCSFTHVKTLNHFFHRHWRLRQYLSYTCSCNWYMNRKFFTNTTAWKQKIEFSFQKRSKLNFDLCRNVEFALVSSISVLY